MTRVRLVGPCPRAHAALQYPCANPIARIPSPCGRVEGAGGGGARRPRPVVSGQPRPRPKGPSWLGGCGGISEIRNQMSNVSLTLCDGDIKYVLM